jgi:hypothetical protein
MDDTGRKDGDVALTEPNGRRAPREVVATDEERPRTAIVAADTRPPGPALDAPASEGEAPTVADPWQMIPW